MRVVVGRRRFSGCPATAFSVFTRVRRVNTRPGPRNPSRICRRLVTRSGLGSRRAAHIEWAGAEAVLEEAMAGGGRARGHRRGGVAAAAWTGVPAGVLAGAGGRASRGGGRESVV